MTTKIDIINNAYSQLRISGILSGDPSPGEIDLALDRLETMAHEYKARDMCVGYNFENEPDTASLHNIDRKFWYAFETSLAMRLIADFGKEIPRSLAMNNQSAMAFLAAETARTPELSYPARMPIGSGNRHYWKGQNYYVNYVETAPCIPQMYVDDVKTFTENFSNFLAEDEDIDSYTLDVESGLEVVDESLSSPVVTYKLSAESVGIWNVQITATALIEGETDTRIETRVSQIQVLEAPI